MCDLIDLNSPDRKSLLNARLASPLIPVPTDTVCYNYNTCTNEPNSVITGKRESLENNPFDMVLCKTTEYIQKKDDPFEVTLEKALRLKYKERTCSLDLTNDVLQQKTYKQKLKLNKTLDEFLINDELNHNNITTAKISNDAIIVHSNNSKILSDNLKPVDVIPTIEIQDFDLSILNQSVMNDTLFEGDKESNKNQMKSILQNKMLMHTKKSNVQFPYPNTALKVSKLRRSLSQGENISPKKSEYLNQISLIEPLRISSGSETNIDSPDSLNLLNEGFLKSHCSGSSVFSSLSDISSIHKLNSVSPTINSSTILSNGTMNRSFLESCSSEKSDNIKLSENMSLNKEIKPAFLTSNDSIISVSNLLTESSILNLADRFNKLKASTSEIHTPENSLNNKNELAYSSSNDIKDCVTVMEKNENCDINNKLIDVDVFSPDNNCTKEHCKSSISDTSSDSVFFEGNKINKSIFKEAKLLAKTFEELAFKTSSGSSIDDLITNNPLWTSELLPAFDDEAMVENLIELPTSPVGCNTKSKHEEVMNSDSHTDKKKELNNKVKEDVKNLEMELTEVISTEKRLTAATLLLDLKKLIKTENNVEANKLVENLERTLGINCKNNTELLTTYLNATNNLAKNPQKSNNRLEIIKNVAENNMEHSHEDNLTSNSIENVKESIFCENINFNDMNTSKCSDNQKYLEKVSSESKCEIPERETNIEEMNKAIDENELNTQSVSKEDPSYKRESSSLLNEKIIIELLENIGKVLSAQTEEHPTWDILKNLGKVLHSTSNCNVDKDMEPDSNYIEIEQTPRKSKLKFQNNTKSSILSKSANRFSLDLGSTKQPVSKKFIRRSMSVSQTQPIKNEPNPLISTSKSISQLKEVTKRFSSDPNLVSTTTNKKIIANNNKNELQKEVKTITASKLQKEKTAMISTVKNKFKKKIDTDVMSKKGPLKAILPIGSMQKRETISKKITPPIGSITPPKSHKLISSTPNSTDSGLKKARSSKPVASSTPDAQNSKTRKIQIQVTNSKKRNFSCDISPVITPLSVNNGNGTNNSPRRKLPSPKKTTPKRRSTESGIPRSQTPPVSKPLNSSFDKNGNSTKQSPLRENNMFINKVKPINLISKLRRHSVDTNIMEKENNYI
ncbi:PREDICTED: uncharacterized protein LOC108574365 [Habropoda laboriosa]|uniref:uncharacterized protein LOC108574365 n=1 Tax=Habropoda laboriosa TaxID=597456 RepID=UPI00083DA432|nr:PREDICTED: uncharacterized protein LOC108574365 [Habropoda laboriosa]